MAGPPRHVSTSLLVNAARLRFGESVPPSFINGSASSLLPLATWDRYGTRVQLTIDNRL